MVHGETVCDVPVAAADRPAPTGGVDILGVRVDVHDRASARREIRRLVGRPGHDVLAFVNAHCINLASRNPAYRESLAGADLLLNDGIGLTVAARLEGVRFPDNLNGTDLLPAVLADLAHSHQRVFLYGADPGVAARAARTWQREIPGLRVVGTLDGYTVSGAVAAELVRAAGADVVLVALGNPGQQLWATTFGPRSGARLTIGVGAFFDFSVGAVRRAPVAVRHLHLEWAFRLVHEPRRLARRYLVGIPTFLLRVGWGQLRAARVSSVAGRDEVVVFGPWPGVREGADPSRRVG